MYFDRKEDFKMTKIVIFGSMPPPVGGVTRSVENLKIALDSISIENRLFSFKALLTRKYDIAHIHYSKPWKIFIASLISKLIARKTIYTKHGGVLRVDNFFLRVSINRLIDGIIFLNKDTYGRYFKLPNKRILFTSLFKEGIQIQNKKLDYFNKKSDFKYLLVYAFDKVLIENKDLYGVDFILNNLEAFDPKYKIVLLDPKSKYKDITMEHLEKIIYLNFTVDFLSLLKNIDIYLRPTRNDGNSVAIIEAMLVNTPVLASDCVQRPNSVTTYELDNFQDFHHKLENLTSEKKIIELSSVNEYLAFCESLG